MHISAAQLHLLHVTVECIHTLHTQPIRFDIIWTNKPGNECRVVSNFVSNVWSCISAKHRFLTWIVSGVNFLEHPCEHGGITRTPEHIILRSVAWLKGKTKKHAVQSVTARR